jgi:hypothetical protein
MRILSTASLPEGHFIIVEDDEGKAFIYFQTQQGYHVFSTEGDWSKVGEVHKFVQEILQQGLARAQSPGNGGADQEICDGGSVTEVTNIGR